MISMRFPFLAWAVVTWAYEVPDVSETEICDDSELAVVMLQTSLSFDKTSENVPNKGERGHAQSARNSLALHGQSAQSIASNFFGQPTQVKYERNGDIALVMACVALMVVLGALVCTCRGSDSRKPRTDCGGLCPCILGDDVSPEDLHSWEVNGEEVFGQCFCQSCIPWPRDLSARQWTWRVAEVNVWIQVAVSSYEVHQSYWIPKAVLKDLQVAFATLMLLASLTAVWWVHCRAVDKMLQYVFCSLITKALYVAAKYAVLSGFITACRLSQMSFAGCNAKGVIAKCVLENSCPQYLLDQAGCEAPGADICAELGIKEMLTRGSNSFMNDVIEMLLFLFGIVPVFMAALARESRAAATPKVTQTGQLQAAAARD